MRHLVVKGAIDPMYLDELFPIIKDNFSPQEVHYNGGVAKVKDWRISCYLEVMDGGVPCTNPNLDLLSVCTPLLESCDDMFIKWYRQQHSCSKRSKNNINVTGSTNLTVKRIMTFITRYTPAPGEEGLLKHVDGAGKVDGSVVVALPIDQDDSFEGHGGGLSFWDGRNSTGAPFQIDYATRSGDIAFIDRAVWHQANPIYKGIRWALVIFYQVLPLEQPSC